MTKATRLIRRARDRVKKHEAKREVKEFTRVVHVVYESQRSFWLVLGEWVLLALFGIALVGWTFAVIFGGEP